MRNTTAHFLREHIVVRYPGFNAGFMELRTIGVTASSNLSA
jgi:hypothetical protein